ncbi:sterol desaturase family protein [Bacillus toyonensis]|uniref:sterol desaturase family protein n=1 Tax=Bacillus toyonensis TaxID=155322 RepID=UPI000BED742D|nr:sterol desaturase family protein [Bacillus toyonensis]PDY94010.1 fatty acid hydroxylase [Bacillus toyonensis]PGE69666.1 fatty acid hydroxylase [Bacillus toyonensis]PHD47087.1 fatty acid hydroxylase [Bacillus toyonensis]PRT20722.1 fatty acid hydroxylase [Bacillus toyonensis]HDR7685619.1 sterol desaturase family protein [Bacillus toyonensis]
MKRVGKEFFLQHDIVIMYSILFIFIIILKMQFFTWIGMLACLFGIVFYTLNKYMTHRFLFHLKPPKNVFLLKMLRRLHYDHHVYPDDLKLLFLPVWFSVPSFTIYLLISYGITKSVTVTLSFGIGMIIMLLVYEWKHYIAHKPIRPVTKFGRWLKNSIYYTIIKTKSFGVSNPVFDFIFGTLKDGKDVELSETARNLEKERSGAISTTSFLTRKKCVRVFVRIGLIIGVGCTKPIRI